MKAEKAVYGVKVWGSQSDDPSIDYFEGEVVGRADVGSGELVVVDLAPAFCGIGNLYIQYLLIGAQYLHLKE